MTEGRTGLGRHTSISRRVITLVAAYALLTAAVLSVLVLYLRNDAILSGHKVLAGFAELANEQTTRTLQSVEQTLEAAAEILSDATAAGPVKAEEIRRQFTTFWKADRSWRASGWSTAGTHHSQPGERHRPRRPDRRVLHAPTRPLRPGLLWGVPVRARRGRVDRHGDASTAAPPATDGLIVGSVPLAFFDHVWKTTTTPRSGHGAGATTASC